MHSRLLVAACLVLVLALPTFAIASDSPSYTTKPTSTARPKTTARETALPAGYASFRSYAREFTLGLPGGWKALPKTHPIVASLAKGQFSSGFKVEFVAYDPKGVRNGYATDCIVLKGTGRGNAPLSSWVAAQVAGLRNWLKGVPFTKRLVHLRGGWALRVSYRTKAKGAKEVWALTYLFDEVTSSYALSCSTTTSLRRHYQPLFDATAKTFVVSG